MAKISKPPSIAKDIIGPPSLGSAYRDAHNLALLLNNMKGGIDCYTKVVNGLEAKYGANFKKLYLQEVSR